MSKRKIPDHSTPGVAIHTDGGNGDHDHIYGPRDHKIQRIPDPVCCASETDIIHCMMTGREFVIDPSIPDDTLIITDRTCVLEFMPLYLLTKALEIDKSLKTLVLLGQKIDFGGGKGFRKILEANHTLKKIILQYIDFVSSASLHWIALGLQVNTSLTTLILYDVRRIHGEGKSDGIASIGEALRHNRTLTKLSIGLAGITDSPNTDKLWHAIKANTRLTCLDLRNNLISGRRSKAMGDALCHNTSLKILDMSGNQLGLRAAKTFAKVLMVNKTLTVLNISWNCIGNAEIRELVTGLQHNRTLTELWIKDSKKFITREGGANLIRGIKHIPTLRILAICGNRRIEWGRGPTLSTVKSSAIFYRARMREANAANVALILLEHCAGIYDPKSVIQWLPLELVHIIIRWVMSGNMSEIKIWYK